MKGGNEMSYRTSKQVLLSACVAFLLITVRADAMKNYKVSSYGSGHQIWFEVENFDERNPDNDSSFALGEEPGAFGQSISSISGDAGTSMIRYDFNIGSTGGKGGTWYFWGRVINPSNQSDYMLVDGHPGDQTPVTKLPVTGLANGQRVFEENAGSAGVWAWSGNGHNEGHTKVLKDNENTMWILSRQAGAIWDVFMWTDDSSYTPTDEDYVNARPGSGYGPATAPSPEDGAMYEDTWASLSWIPGDFAVSHDVYFGENFDDVNNGTGNTFQGNQAEAFFVVGFPGFAYPDGLVPGTTYYWRVDEVNQADANSPWRGPVWSFWIPPRTAYRPYPADDASYVSTDVQLSWAGGFKVKLHTVYFGDNFDNVSAAAGGIPQANTTYKPGALELGKTYYWRVDEFDGTATHKGNVWSFTTLPNIPITDPNLVGWWKFEAGSGTTVVDFSGHGNNGTIVDNVLWVPGMFNIALEFLGDDKGHVELPPGIVSTAKGSILMWVNTDLTDDEGMMWYGTETGGDGFGDENEIHLHVDDPGVLGFGMEGSTDIRLDGPQIAGAGWVHVAATWDQKDGCRLYFNGAEVDFQAYTANVANLTVIRLGRPVGTGNGNRYYDGLMDDVRLFNHAISPAQVSEIMSKGEDPLKAGSPKPSNGALVGIDDALPLSWSAGEEAAEHDVYFGTDKDAVTKADASDTTGIYRNRQSGTSYTPPEGVEWGGGPYYWRIDEFNKDGSIRKGGIWSFTVSDFIPVEDFESYTNNDAANEAIWQHWIDGFGVPENGSQAGDLLPPYAEQTIVHGGGQSMPLYYENTAGVKYSEAELKLTAPRDWTKHGVGELSIWFQGRPASVGSFVEGPVGTYTITATGADIWNQADQFHFAYKTLSGSGSIEAKVLSVQRTDNWAKAGVMIRETLDAGSKFAAVYITPTAANGAATNGCRFQARTDTDASATSDTSVATPAQTAIIAPYWIKLERTVSGAFRGYYSSDGVTWTSMSWNPQAITMASDVYVGLALTSHNNNATCEAKFSNVKFTGTVGQQWANQDIGITSNDAEPLYVSISNSTGQPAVVVHDNANAAQITAWTEWVIPLSAFSDQGINLTNVDRIAIGLGSRTNATTPGGSGKMYFDDIRLYRPNTAP